MKDERLYAKFALDFADHAKIVLYEDGFPEYAYPERPQEWSQLTVPGRWFVYVMFGRPRQGDPNYLYIGMTGNLAKRLSQHRRTKSWWPAVEQIMVGLVDTRAEALEWESDYIRRTQPAHNIIGNPGRF